jgi:hypothetical protein
MKHRIVMTAVILAASLGIPTTASWANTGSTPHVASPVGAGPRVFGSVAQQMSSVFLVPKATCSTTNTSSFIELGNYSTENAPTNLELSGAGVNINCNNAVAQYQPYTFHQSEPTRERDYTNTVRPGDAILISVAAMNSKCDALIADLTRGWSESWNVTCTIEGIAGGELGFDRSGPILTEVGSTVATNLALYHKVFFLVATGSGKSIAKLPAAPPPPTTPPAGTVALRNLTGGSTYLATMQELQVLGGFTVTWLKAS